MLYQLAPFQLLEQALLVLGEVFEPLLGMFLSVERLMISRYSMAISTSKDSVHKPCHRGFLSCFVQLNQPALRITANDRNRARQVQVNRFNVASALLALLNMELPLAANPPMPSPLGLCSSTKTISRMPVPIQLQDRIEVSIRRKEEGERS